MLMLPRFHAFLIPRAALSLLVHAPRKDQTIALATGICSIVAFRVGLAGVSASSAHPRNVQPFTAVAVPGLQMIQAPLFEQTAAQIDGGLHSAITQDRTNGFRDGMTESLRDGERTIRLTVKQYFAPGGARLAYANVDRFLQQELPDPTLRITVRHLGGLGSAATLGTYVSSFGINHYTVSALVAVGDTRICEAQSYPTGISDGLSARHRSDLLAVVRACLAEGAWPR